MREKVIWILVSFTFGKITENFEEKLLQTIKFEQFRALPGKSAKLLSC